MQRRASSQVGGADRLRRTDVDALGAAAAVLARGRIRWQRQVAVDFAEEEPRPGVARQQQGVLAAPADAGPRRQLDLHHRRRVREHAVAERTGLALHALAQLLQPHAQQPVIVAPAGVARDVGAPAVAERRPFVARGGSVVHAAADHALRSRHQFGRPRAQRAVARHIIHVALPAHAQPLGEPPFGGREIGGGDADGLEAELTTPLLDFRRERVVVHMPDTK